MKCRKKYCPNDMETCCADCQLAEIYTCKDRCARAKRAEECLNYENNKETELEKETEKKMLKWIIIFAICIIVILVYCILWTADTMAYIDEVQTKSGLPVAADQSAMSSKEDKSSTNYSIPDSEVMSNDRYCNRSNHR